MKFKYDTILVITNASLNQGASFPLSEVSAFEIRGNGALSIMDGNTIFRAYAAGQWEMATLANSKQINNAMQHAETIPGNGGS